MLFKYKKEIDEEFVVARVKNYMENEKKDGNWHPDKTIVTDLHEHGPDLVLVGGKRNSEYFYIECKGKSSSKSVLKEGWLNALGQIITRMDVKRYSKSRDGKTIRINKAYHYGLGLYWQTAQVALRRIPKEAAEVLNLYIFAVNDKGDIIFFTPSQFGTNYPNDYFI